MFQETLSHTEMVLLPVLAMLLFATVFVAVVIRVWRRGNDHPKYQHLAHLPLADDDATPLQEGENHG